MIKVNFPDLKWLDTAQFSGMIDFKTIANYFYCNPYIYIHAWP